MVIELSIVYKSIKDSLKFLLDRKAVTREQGKEILDAVSRAVQETESLFYETGSRDVRHNRDIAEAWRQAGVLIETYFPKEHLGVWIMNKSHAWIDPEAFSAETLREHKMELKQIEAELTRIRKIWLH
jgi:hypothetical protein